MIFNVFVKIFLRFQRFSRCVMSCLVLRSSTKKNEVLLSRITLVMLRRRIRTKWEFISIFGQTNVQDTSMVEERLVQNGDFGAELLGLEDSSRFWVNSLRGYNLDIMYKSKGLTRSLNFGNYSSRRSFVKGSTARSQERNVMFNCKVIQTTFIEKHFLNNFKSYVHICQGFLRKFVMKYQIKCSWIL